MPGTKWITGDVITFARMNQKTMIMQAAEPALMYVGMCWFDTDDNYLRQRNKDNNGWLMIGIWTRDTIGNRPAFGAEGRIFWATDTDELWWDTGAAWVQIMESVALKDGNYAAAYVGISGTATGRAANLDLIDSTEAAGPFSYLDAGGEQDVYEDAVVTRRRIWIEVSNRNMTQTGNFVIYRKVNGANYDVWLTQACTVGAGDDRVFDAEFTINQHWKITYEEDVNEGAARDIPYNVIVMVIE